MTFFQKVHFIQKCSVTQNTVFQYVKNIFLLSQKKLIFFTELNLSISISILYPVDLRHGHVPPRQVPGLRLAAAQLLPGNIY